MDLTQLPQDPVKVRAWASAMHLLPGTAMDIGYEIEQVRQRLLPMSADARQQWEHQQADEKSNSRTGFKMSAAQQARLAKILVLGEQTEFGKALASTPILHDLRLSWIIEANSRPPTGELL